MTHTTPRQDDGVPPPPGATTADRSRRAAPPGDAAATARPARRQWRPDRGALASWALVLGVAAALVGAVLARNPWLFHEPIAAEGDFALNAMLADQGKHLTLWEGNYSRVGFHHPGPALLYVMTAGAAVFHRLIPVAPSEPNAMVIGQIVVDGLLTGGVALAVKRLTGSAAAGCVVAALSYLPVVTLGGAAIPWMPYQYMPAYALFVVAGAAVAAGTTRSLPSFVLGAGLIAHGQVSFLAFVAATTVVVAVSWAVRHRHRIRADLAGARGPLLTAVGLLVLFVLPLVLQVAFRHSWWGAYVQYSTGPGQQHHPLGATVQYLRWYLGSGGVPGKIVVGAGALAVVLMATDRDRARRSRSIAVAVVLLVQGAVTLYYGARGVDALIEPDHYLLFFVLVLPPMIVGLTAVLLTARVRSLWAARHDTVPVGRVVTAAGAVCAVVLAAWAATRPTAASTYRGLPGVGTVTARLAQAPERAGRAVSLELPAAQFAVGAGVVYELGQRGIHACVWNPEPSHQATWAVVFTPAYVCGADRSRTWQLALTATPPPPGVSPVYPLEGWQGARLAVVPTT